MTTKLNWQKVDKVKLKTLDLSSFYYKTSFDMVDFAIQTSNTLSFFMLTTENLLTYSAFEAW